MTRSAASLLIATLFAFGALGSQCDGLESDPVTLESTRCQPRVAQIQVLDGRLKRLCGCNESGDTLITPPSTLTCTVTNGTVIYFHFIGSHTRHQIVPVGTPALTSSTIWNPSDDTDRGAIFSWISGPAGTYSFKDQFDSQLSGEIVTL